MRKIKKGDNVVVLAGRDKGKRGEVTRDVGDDYVLGRGRQPGQRGIRGRTRCKNQPGGIVAKEMPIHVSNVAIWNPVTQKPDRIGFRQLNDGRKVRFFKSNGEVLGVLTMARLKEILQEGDRAGADQAVRLQVDDAGAAPHEDRAEHGRGRGRSPTRRSSRTRWATCRSSPARSR